MNVPRYQVVSSTLQKRIAAGEYPVGSTLPTEQVLCAEFDVSRYTVREALRRLAELGIVARRQGSGSEVLSAEPSNNYVQTMRSLRQLFEYASETVLEILSTGIIVADDRLSGMLGRASGREWLRVEAVRHFKSGEPICYSEIHIHSDFKDAEPVLRGLKGPFYAYFEEHHGATIDEVIQTISAEPFPERAAAAMGVPTDDMAIKVERRYLGGDDGPVQISTNWHLADSFSYTMTLKREEH